jgi:predicted ATPase
MFSDLHLEQFGAFSEFRWSDHGQVNVIVGENDTGKSHLLKILYVIARSYESLAERAVTKGSYDRRSWEEIVDQKLRSTYQPAEDILAALVRDGAKRLKVAATLAGRACSFSVVGNKVSKPTGPAEPVPNISATFLPPKEVFTIFSAIELAQDRYVMGFDDTYYDLIKQLRIAAAPRRIDDEMASILREPEHFLQGRFVRKKGTDEFVFVRGERSYTMPQTADGLKKIGVLTRLIANRSLRKGSILFLDEPETNLHPRAISMFTNMLFRLGQAGVQVYLATHSYFVIKQLEILAKQKGTRVPFCSLLRQGEEVEARFSDLREGMPDNPIIDESLRLYQQGIDVDMGG